MQIFTINVYFLVKTVKMFTIVVILFLFNLVIR